MDVDEKRRVLRMKLHLMMLRQKTFLFNQEFVAQRDYQRGIYGERFLKNENHNIEKRASDNKSQGNDGSGNSVLSKTCSFPTENHNFFYKPSEFDFPMTFRAISERNLRHIPTTRFRKTKILSEAPSDPPTFSDQTLRSRFRKTLK